MAPYSAVVLGGGISGLTAAYYLARMGRKVALVEASNRLGGWMKTIRHGDGVFYEEGPRSIRPMGPSARSTCLLIEDLELEHRVGTLYNKPT
jgi:oxygen-dependent protoporphyrinogen oxidase